MKKANIVQIKSEYKASWWWLSLYDRPTSVAEWKEWNKL